MLVQLFNLTRSSGAGSFAHEFFHALDYRLGKKMDTNWYLTDNLVDLHCLYYQAIDKDLSASENQIRQITSLYEVYKAIGGFGDWYTDYYKRSATLAGQHGAKKYWIETIELFARAFESYIQDALSSQGRFSPWLVHGTLESDCQPGRESMWPYPIAEERTVINKQFEVFIQTLTTK